MEQLWQQCMRKLEGDLSGSDLSTYIRPLLPQLDDKRLTLLAPNAAVHRRVREDFLPIIRKRVSRLAGGENLSVEIKVGLPRAAAEAAGEEAEPAPELRSPGYLNPRYTFETFIEGKSNARARAAAHSVAQTPGTQYNPLLIYGESGMGKTHLMHAIGNTIRARNPRANVIYVGAERFFRDLITAIQQNKTEDFKKRYRSADALLMDDIQFIANKQSGQEEMFHTFNELLDGRQQMVLTCDRYPEELENLDKRLKSRFTWGLTQAVEPPDLETRAAIFLSKSELAGIKVSHDVALFIAQRIRSNVRQLEGALNRISASVQLTGREITVDFVRETLKDMLTAYERLITVDSIKRHVSRYYNIRETDLVSARRTRSLARPRQVAMALAKELTQHSLPEIGQSFGKDHTTVLHACRKVAELRKDDITIREDYEKLLRQLSG